MRLFLATAAVAASLSAGAAQAADKWEVREGPQGKVRGVWEVQRQQQNHNHDGNHGNRPQQATSASHHHHHNAQTYTGSAQMELVNGQKLKYSVLGSKKEGVFMFQRLSPTDGKLCNYRGQKQPDGTITGTAFCGSDTHTWSAKKIQAQG
jgi:hypothetical protein